MTQSEINKLYKSIATDFKIVARKTELMEIEYCYQILHDIKKLMTYHYLESVSLVLNNVNDVALKAKKYLIGYVDRSQDDRPGGIDWEDGEGHRLYVHVMYTENYKTLNADQRVRFQQDNLKNTWYDSNIDADFPHLSPSLTKRYTHSNSGVDRLDYN